MKNAYFSLPLAVLLAAPVLPAYAKQRTELRNPEPGVLCDQYVCATSKSGISRELTAKYLGQTAASKLAKDMESDFDPTEFSFANGVFCDVKERKCRADRYYGEDGKHNGVILNDYTKLFFGE